MRLADRYQPERLKTTREPVAAAGDLAGIAIIVGYYYGGRGRVPDETVVPAISRHAS